MDHTTNVPPEHVFHFEDGKKAHNLHDMRNAINTMKDDVLAHHLEDNNNDFANWIEFVYKNVGLADDLRKVSTQKEMVELIDTELGNYGGAVLEDKEVVDGPFEKPIKLSDPPQTMLTHKGEIVHTISTEAPHKFIVKEFFWGLLTGLLIGIILFASLMYLGIFPGVI